jgi:hypothetical protein
VGWSNPIEHSSGRCASSPWLTPTTPTTQHRPENCTPTYAGATPTTATPTSSPHNAENAPGYVANDTTGGAVLNPEQHDQTR